MALSERPSRQVLDNAFAARRRETYDDMVQLGRRIHAVMVRGDQTFVYEIDEPTRTVLTSLSSTGGQRMRLSPVGEFYTFHTVNWAHTRFRPTLAEIFASMPQVLRDNSQVYGVSVKQIYGTSEFGSESWHVGLATAYTRA